MTIKKKLLLSIIIPIVICTPYFMQANPFRPCTDFFAKTYSALLSHFSFSYRPDEAALVIKKAAEQARDRSRLYKLERIQAIDMLLLNKVTDPFNKVIQALQEHSDDCAAHLKKIDTNMPLIQQEMEKNLKNYDALFPHGNGYITAVGDYQEGLYPDLIQEKGTIEPKEYRDAISLQKYRLQERIRKREGRPYQYTTPKLFDYAPSEDFINELKWHKQRTEEIKSKTQK